MRAAPWRGPAWMADRYPESGLGFRLLMAMIDGLLALACLPWRGKAAAPFPAVPRRILVIATAHLGDVVIATSALRDLRRLYPRARLGVVIGSWSRAVLADHPGIEWTHLIDHPRINRRERGVRARLRQFMRTARVAVPAIRAIGYDVVFDLQERHSLLPLVPAFGIPHRIGFGTGGWAPLLTGRIDWRGAGRHRADQHRRLVLRGDDARARDWPMPAAWLGDTQPGAGTLPAALPERYLLLHPGAGDPAKRWSDDAWTDLAVRLNATRLPIVCAGLGADDRRLVARLRAAGLAPVDLVDSLSFTQLLRVVRGARGVVCMDSVTAHLAAAAGVPVVAITSGVAPAGRFAPLGLRVAVLTHPVPCAPCHAFCAEVDCVRGVRPEAAVRVMQRLLAPMATAQATAQATAHATAAAPAASGPPSPQADPRGVAA